MMTTVEKSTPVKLIQNWLPKIIPLNKEPMLTRITLTKISSL